jgi:sulfur transfer complex TusBCD TusB component (DsrH family)
MPEPPIMRRDVLQEDEAFLLQEDGVSKLVISFGTFDSIVLEDGTSFLLQEDLGKFILTVY